jgi:hypothetical protein
MYDRDSVKKILNRASTENRFTENQYAAIEKVRKKYKQMAQGKPTFEVSLGFVDLFSWHVRLVEKSPYDETGMLNHERAMEQVIGELAGLVEPITPADLAGANMSQRGMAAPVVVQQADPSLNNRVGALEDKMKGIENAVESGFGKMMQKIEEMGKSSGKNKEPKGSRKKKSESGAQDVATFIPNEESSSD